MNSSHLQTLYNKFVSLDCEVQGHIHAGLRSAPINNKAYVRRYSKRLLSLQNQRDEAKKQYYELKGILKIPDQTRKQKIIETAQGHEDNRSVQAARNICEKNRWKY